VAYTAIAGRRSTVMLRDLRRRAAVVVAHDATDPSISSNGRVVAFSSTAAAPGKPTTGAASSCATRAPATTRLASAVVPPPGGGPKPPLAPPVKAVSAPAALGAHQVAIVDNAFHRGSDRPVVRLDTGQRVTWLWRSRQSHEVTVYSGPSALHSPTQSHGRYSVRLTRPAPTGSSAPSTRPG
jgi:hypothetical protein